MHVIVCRYFTKLLEGHVYYISGGQIKQANKKFTSVKNDYEIVLTNTTEVEVRLLVFADLIHLRRNVTTRRETIFRSVCTRSCHSTNYASV